MHCLCLVLPRYSSRQITASRRGLPVNSSRRHERRRVISVIRLSVSSVSSVSSGRGGQLIEDTAPFVAVCPLLHPQGVQLVIHELLGEIAGMVRRCLCHVFVFVFPLPLCFHCLCPMFPLPLCSHHFRGLRHCLCPVFPLPLCFRCLCVSTAVVFPPPSRLQAQGTAFALCFHCLCDSTAFAFALPSRLIHRLRFAAPRRAPPSPSPTPTAATYSLPRYPRGEPPPRSHRRGQRSLPNRPRYWHFKIVQNI